MRKSGEPAFRSFTNIKNISRTTPGTIVPIAYLAWSVWLIALGVFLLG